MARAIRSFTIDHDVSHRLDEHVAPGDRSQFINELLVKALPNKKIAVATITMTISFLCSTFALLVAFAV